MVRLERCPQKSAEAPDNPSAALLRTRAIRHIERLTYVTALPLVE